MISLIESSKHLIKIEVLDFKKNITKIFIPIEGDKHKNILNNDNDFKIGDINKLFINRNKRYFINQHNSSLHIEKETFYNNLFIKKSKWNVLSIYLI